MLYLTGRGRRAIASATAAPMVADTAPAANNAIQVLREHAPFVTLVDMIATCIIQATHTTLRYI